MSADTAGSEWTQVVRKSKRSSQRSRSPKQDQEDVTTEVRPNPSPSFTIEDIRSCHQTIRAEWQASECHRLLREEILNKTLQSYPTIKKAICLGPGSFDPANGSWASRRTAHMQVEAFRTLAHALGTLTSFLETTVSSPR